MADREQPSGGQRRLTRRQLEALTRRYEKALGQAAEKEEARLRIAQELYEHALTAEGVQVRLVYHRLGGRGDSPEAQSYPLGAPEVGLLFFNRFCNIWVAVPLAVCIAFGCPPVAVNAGQVCILLACDVDVCTLANGNAITLRCGYLCFTP